MFKEEVSCHRLHPGKFPWLSVLTTSSMDLFVQFAFAQKKGSPCISIE